jgi:hypothetical protein
MSEGRERTDRKLLVTLVLAVVVTDPAASAAASAIGNRWLWFPLQLAMLISLVVVVRYLRRPSRRP